MLTASDKSPKLLGFQELAVNSGPELQRGRSVLLQEVCPPLPNHHWAGPLSLPEQAPPFSVTCPEFCAHPDAAKNPGADVAADWLLATGTLWPDLHFSWRELWVLPQEPLTRETISSSHFTEEEIEAREGK